LIVIPAAFLFLGPANATGSTFTLGFVTMPAIMHFMPLGSLFGGMWFGLLFLAAVTSTISMLQPAIAFLEDGFGLRRRSSVTVLGLITLAGASLIMYFSENVQALDFTDFWCEFMMILAALGQVIIFGWVFGAGRGVAEANQGADFKLPRCMPFVIRYVTPTFLLLVLILWCTYNGPERLRGMSPTITGAAAARGVYADAIAARLELDDEEELATQVTQILGVAEGVPRSLDGLPAWLREADADAKAARTLAGQRANVARFVFVGVLLFYIGIFALSDIACRGRIKEMLARAQRELPETEARP
ncbi:MAG: hypothetical protein KKB50_08130, partial [Planctomycetes bacterium]|nr:hypothetical protein [Planctomycetota bacterium]